MDEKQKSMSDLCDYGCGQKGEYEMNNGKVCCSENWQSCPAMRKKNSEGLKKAFEEGRKDTEHLDGHRGWSKGKMKKDPKEILCKNSDYTTGRAREFILRHNLLQYECSNCSRSEWQGEELSLELHHKNGNNRNHRLDNLEFLCPNCHSLTEGWRKKQVSGNKKVSDEKILNEIPECKSIRQVCLKVGISGKGGNHPRVRRLIENNEVELA